VNKIRLPTLDEIGAAQTVHCWRMRREPDERYAARLALLSQSRIIELEKLLTACLAIKTNPELWEQSPSDPTA
jgi:hypothetical protein